MRKYGMPERINEEVFIAMAKALDFIDPGKKITTLSHRLSIMLLGNKFLSNKR